MSRAEDNTHKEHGASERSQDSLGEILLMRLESARQRRKDLQEKLNALTTNLWTDPTRHEKPARAILEDLEKAEREEEDLLEKYTAHLFSREGLIASLHAEMRTSLEREYDLEKHVTTLSTASILGVAALTKLFEGSPDLEAATAQSLICFLIAIVTAIFAMAGTNLEHLSVGSRKNNLEQSRIRRITSRGIKLVMSVSGWACLTAFCSGLLVIIMFVIRAA
jgi:hypothetical protein